MKTKEEIMGKQLFESILYDCCFYESFIGIFIHFTITGYKIEKNLNFFIRLLVNLK